MKALCFSKKNILLILTVLAIFSFWFFCGCGQNGGSLDVYSVVEPPVFSPSSGTYTESQTVTISSPTPGAQIYYTTDDSEPKETSTKYSGPITITTSVKIKAKAFASPKIPSITTSATYIITGTVATPTFSPEAGTYASAQSVSISCLTSGANITYTLDGSTPTETSTVYENPITISSTTTIKAKAFLEDYESSQVSSATYYIGQTQTPVFSTPSGSYSGITKKDVIINGESGSTIYYTTDGSTPTIYSSSQPSPATITLALDSTSPVKTWQIKAFSRINNKAQSDITTESYTLSITTESGVVDSSGVGQFCSIAIDSNGNPHVCYFDETGKIKHSYKNSGSWNTPVVINAGVGANGGYTDMAINSSSNVIHVVYYDGNNGQLKHAYSSSPWISWNINVIDSGVSKAFPKIVLDTNGNPHVTYYDSADKKVKYAYSTASPWNTWSFIDISENAVNDDNTGRSSIAVDPAGYIYVLFIDDGKIKSKTNSPLGSYITKEVFSYSDNEYYLDIGLGSGTGSEKKVYAVFSSPQLCYSQSDNSASSWLSSPITISSSSLYQHLSLAIDNSSATDILHLCSYDSAITNLKYFTNSQGDWEEFCLDNNVKTGSYCSLALDSSKKIHVCYYDEQNKRLKYATNR